MRACLRLLVLLPALALAEPLPTALVGTWQVDDVAAEPVLQGLKRDKRQASVLTLGSTIAQRLTLVFDAGGSLTMLRANPAAFDAPPSAEVSGLTVLTSKGNRFEVRVDRKRRTETLVFVVQGATLSMIGRDGVQVPFKKVK